jgi:hypothetical protein
LNAIIGFSQVLRQEMFGSVSEAGGVSMTSFLWASFALADQHPGPVKG